MNHAYICSYSRTAIGAYLGSLRSVAATQLGAYTIKSTLEKSKIYNLYCLLGALSFATSYSVKSENKIEICQDLKNKFLILTGLENLFSSTL